MHKVPIAIFRLSFLFSFFSFTTIRKIAVINKSNKHCHQLILPNVKSPSLVAESLPISCSPFFKINSKKLAPLGINLNNIKLINEYLLEEISKIDAKKIKEYGDIEYYFKR